MTTTSTTPPPCPNCSAPASGRFCASCGVPLEGAACTACGAPLSAGARFCHRCGTPAGTAAAAPRRADPPGAGISNALPWAVASIALLAVVALVAGQRFGTRGAPPSDGAAIAGTVDDGGGSAPALAPRAPDISNMSPRERAARLFNKIMVLDEAGKKDSVAFFSVMGISAFQMLDTLDADARYDMGRIGEVSGALPVAKAQADTILAHAPTHLLGLILAARTARLAGLESEARAYDARFLAAEPAELRKGLPEYEAHRADIERALTEARRRTGR